MSKENLRFATFSIETFRRVMENRLPRYKEVVEPPHIISYDQESDDIVTGRYVFDVAEIASFQEVQHHLGIEDVPIVVLPNTYRKRSADGSFDTKAVYEAYMLNIPCDTDFNARVLVLDGFCAGQLCVVSACANTQNILFLVEVLGNEKVEISLCKSFEGLWVMSVDRNTVGGYFVCREDHQQPVVDSNYILPKYLQN